MSPSSDGANREGVTATEGRLMEDMTGNGADREVMGVRVARREVFMSGVLEVMVVGARICGYEMITLVGISAAPASLCTASALPLLLFFPRP